MNILDNGVVIYDLVLRCNIEFYGLLYQLDVVKCIKFERLKWADNID
jgi:hypothetical protein